MRFQPSYELLVIATLFWGGNFVIGRGIANDVPPFTLAFIRWIIAFLFLLPLGWREIRDHISLLKKHWLIILILSITGVAGYNTFIYIALHETTTINATIVNSTTPALIILVSLFYLREKLSLIQYVGIFLSMVGVLWTISSGSFLTLFSLSFNKGEAWVILAVVIWSIYSALMKKYGSILPNYGLFLLTVGIALVILFPFALYEWMSGITIHWSFSSISALLYLGSCASVVAFLCWNNAVKKIGPGKSAPFLNLIPIFASTFAIIFLDETLTAPQIIGGLIVFIGVMLTTVQGRRKIAKKSTS